jgi:hypothetical protein
MTLLPPLAFFLHGGGSVAPTSNMAAKLSNCTQDYQLYYATSSGYPDASITSMLKKQDLATQTKYAAICLKQAPSSKPTFYEQTASINEDAA